ncbi:DUF4837 family protein [Labilibacter marinus]|uniref:DUF4837 family protein n=1 Tax=Labilibacter marinus TaxID=1477105 RepID=UPI0008307D28|nr:DUF4837 family protein [Labilibacter marinus]
MRNTIYFLLTLLITLSACKTKPNAHKPNPSGAAGVMIIVMNDAVKKTEAGKTLWDMMVQPMVGLPQEEPMFDASVIPHRSLSDFIKTYRNLVVVEVDQSVKENKIKYYKGTWAKQQALVRIYAKDTDSMLEMVKENELKLVGFFTRAERDRLSAYFKSTFNSELKKKVENKFKHSINVPLDFKLRKDTTDFLWMSHETSTSSLGLMVYSVDYVGEGSFSKEYLLNKRNEILRNQVPGPSKGSYMTTEQMFPVNYQVIKTPTDPNAVVLRGLWKVQGDMMGGPFISMAHHDKASNKVIVTEGYSFNPEKPKKRNMVRQLEAILYSYTPLKKDK